MRGILLAYLSITVLTLALVVMNVHTIVAQFVKDQNQVRLYAYLGTLLFLGSLIIGITGNVIDRVIDSENQLLEVKSPYVKYY